jgi:hypothetical protein
MGAMGRRRCVDGCTHLKMQLQLGCVGKESRKAVAKLKNFQLQLF